MKHNTCTVIVAHQTVWQGHYFSSLLPVWLIWTQSRLGCSEEHSIPRNNESLMSGAVHLSSGEGEKRQGNMIPMTFHLPSHQYRSLCHLQIVPQLHFWCYYEADENTVQQKMH